MNDKGGLAKGPSHKEGGIKATVKSTGQNIEFEGGEVIINKRNVADETLLEFEGEKKTTCEILSDLNSRNNNGVTLECDSVEGKKYEFEEGGKLESDQEVDYDSYKKDKKDRVFAENGVKIKGNSIDKFTQGKLDEFKETYQKWIKSNNKGYLKVLSTMIYNFFDEVVVENPKMIYALFYMNSLLPEKEKWKIEVGLHGNRDKDLFLSNLKRNPYLYIPKSLRVDSKISKVKGLEFESNNKAFRKIMGKFVSDDDLRPALMHAYVFERGAVATDAHKFLFIKGEPTTKQQGQVCVSSNCDKLDEKDKNHRYPNFEAIVPRNFNSELGYFKVSDLFNFLRTIIKTGMFSKRMPKIRLSYDGYEFDCNINSLIDVLKSMLELGHDKISFGFQEDYDEKYKKPVIIAPAFKLNEPMFDRDFALLMPVVTQDDVYFTFDLGKREVLFNGEYGLNDLDSVSDFEFEVELDKFFKEINENQENPYEKYSEQEIKGLEVILREVEGLKEKELESFIDHARQKMVYRILKPLSDTNYSYTNGYFFPTKPLGGFIYRGFQWLFGRGQFNSNIVFEETTGQVVKSDYGMDFIELEEVSKKILDNNADALKDLIFSKPLTPQFDSSSKTFEESLKIEIENSIQNKEFKRLFERLANKENKDSRKIFGEIVGRNITNYSNEQLNNLFDELYSFNYFKLKEEQAKAKMEEEQAKEDAYWKGIVESYPMIDFTGDDNKTIKRVQEQLDKKYNYSWGIGTVYQDLVRSNPNVKMTKIDKWTKSGELRSVPKNEYWIGSEGKGYAVVPKLIYDRFKVEEK